MKERAKQLAAEHWDKYVGPMLATHGIESDALRLCEFHYKSAAFHFHGHGVEDERNRAKGASNAAFENDTPIAAYTEAVEIDAAAKGLQELKFAAGLKRPADIGAADAK